jgi:uncharacterized protein involved in type VI secretion and phage assembly
VNTEPGSIHYAVVEDDKLDAEGRIRITIPSSSSKAGAYAARIGALGAGNDRGLQFLPERHEQVLVVFVNGAPGEPVVIGGVWSRKSKPPGGNADGNNDVKVIKTRGGNVIRLTDSKDSEKIEIVTPSSGTVTIQGRQITLDGDVSVTGKLVVGKASKTTIDGNKITGS